jgi:hypothetical protein
MMSSLEKAPNAVDSAGSPDIMARSQMNRNRINTVRPQQQRYPATIESDV